MYLQVVHIQHNVSSAISMSAWSTTFDVWPVCSALVYVEAASIGKTKDKLNMCVFHAI